MPKRNFEVKTTFKGVDKTSRVIGKIQTSVSRGASKMSRAMKKLDRFTSSVARTMTRGLKWGAIAAVGAFTTLVLAGKSLLKQFSKIEDAEAAFTPLLGGAKRAKEMVQALNETAATTPFQFENLAGAANQLLPIMNGDIKKTIEYTRMLGDTSGGNAQKFQSITRGFTKAMMKGKADMESLNMIAEAGVPIFDQLSTEMGKTGPALFKAISAGDITSEKLIGTFKNMTAEGGIFFNGMEIASKTLSGKISTLKDVFGLTAAELGEVLAPTIKDVVDELIGAGAGVREWVRANRGLIKSKFQEFVRKIPPMLKEAGKYARIFWGYLKKLPQYFDEIAYWAPKVAKYIGIFYAVAAAVKVSNFALSAFSTLVAIDFGPIKKMGNYMGGNLPKEIGKAKGAVGKFQGALGVLTSFVIGWEIGTILYDKIVKPFQDSMNMMKRVNQEADEMNKFGTGDLSDSNLKQKRGMMTEALADEKGSWWQSDEKIGHLETQLRIIDHQLQMNEMKRATSDLNTWTDTPKIFGGSGDASEPASSPSPAAVPVSPTVNLSRESTETLYREESEVTIKDETGKARITKGGKRKGFKLVHSGGMS